MAGDLHDVVQIHAGQVLSTSTRVLVRTAETEFSHLAGLRFLLFDSNAAVIAHNEIVTFLDSDRAILRQQGKHRKAHAEVRGQEAVTEESLQFVVIGSGILDAGHSPS